MTVVNLVDKSGTDANESLGCRPQDFTANGITEGSGQIAVVQRGSCARVRKAAAGQQAGAAAVIMVNSTAGFPPFEGPITSIPEEPDLDPSLPAEDYEVTIPFLGVPSTDEATLTAANGKSLTLAAAPAPLPNLTYRAYTDFSSAGPRMADSAVRPGIAAPGENISSVGVGTGNKSALMSGTSMATPHVAGVAALARQAHKGWKSREISAALVGTADPSKVAGYGVVLGGGLVDAKQVVNTKVFAYGDTSSSRAGTVYDASLSFGFAEPSGSYTRTKKLTLVNKSTKKVTFRLSNEKAKQSRKASVRFSPKKVTVSAKKSRTVKVTLRVKASQLGNSMSSTDQFSFREVSGNVKITSSGGNGTLRVPYLLVPRARAKVAASQKVVTLSPALSAAKPDATASSSPSPSASPTTSPAPRRALDVTLTNRKGALKTTADFYTWGQSDPKDLPTEAPGGIDLRASGVQALPNGKDQLLVFAVNSWTRWSNAAALEFDVEIDTDGDGDANYLLFSDDIGTLDPSGESDGVARVFLYDIAEDVLYDTDREAVAPTDSSTILLPIDASALGLDADSKPFSYRVSSYSIIDDAMDEIDGWADYDLGSPSIANGDYVPVKVNGKVKVRLAVDVDAVQRLQPKGTMIVVLDNKSGKDEALLLPTPKL
ncbi:MAG: S8 family serine peptidase [Micropruina sp.]